MEHGSDWRQITDKRENSIRNEIDKEGRNMFLLLMIKNAKLFLSARRRIISRILTVSDIKYALKAFPGLQTTMEGVMKGDFRSFGG